MLAVLCDACMVCWQQACLQQQIYK
jgi:hypothetical protein